MSKEITRDIVIASLEHCARTDVRCCECPCGGAPACKDIYRKAVEIIKWHERIIAQQSKTIHEKDDEIKQIKQTKSDQIHQMWEAMLNVQKVYAQRNRELQKENETLRRL